MTARVTVIRGVRVFDPASSIDEIADVVIERGVFARIGKGAGDDPAKSENALVIDGSGQWLLPGFIDLHAHLREPGDEAKEDIASGLEAAAAGGFVDVCVMPNTRPTNDDPFITRSMLARSREIGKARLHPIGAITVGQRGEALTDMARLRDAGIVAVSDDGRCVTRSDVMKRAFEYAKTFDLPVVQHAEDHALTEGSVMHEGAISTRLGLRGAPSAAEDVIVARDLILAEYTDSRYHLAHASTRGSVRLVRDAKDRGIRVTAEVTPHHLLLTDAKLLGYDAVCRVNPPLREEADTLALIEGLRDGTIDCIATDHAPHTQAEKERHIIDAPPGMVSLSFAFPLLVTRLVDTGLIPLSCLVAALTSGPARAFSFPAPILREGRPADCVLFDPARLGPSRRTKSWENPAIHPSWALH